MRRCKTVLFIFTGLLPIFVATHASAVVCMVTDTASLATAIANAACTTVELQNSITLNNDLPAINRDLTIDGGGTFAIDGDGAFQALHIASNVPINVTISNVTITGARAQGGTGGGSGLGGAIFAGNNAAVTISNVTLSNNEAIGGSGGTGGGSGRGGALFAANNAVVTISNVTLSNNEAIGGAGGSGGTGGPADGGGLYAEGGATVIVNGPLGVVGNSTQGGTGGSGGTGGQGGGGGIYVASGATLTLNAAAVLQLTNNVATGGTGGSGGGSGGDAFGGGIYSAQGTDTMVIGAVTLAGNQAVGGTGTGGTGQGSGGGIYNQSGNIVLAPSIATSQTLADPIAGGGGLTLAGPGRLTLSGTNSYTGPTLVQQGVLAVANSNALGSGALTVASGAEFDLNTTLQTTGGLSLDGTLEDTLGGTGRGNYGVLDVPGTATIHGKLAIVLGPKFVLAVDDTFDIMDFDSLSGDFSAFSFDGDDCIWSPSISGGIANCARGLTFLLSDMPGNAPDDFYQLQVTSAAVPEPGTLALMASAFSVLLLSRRTLRVGRSCSDWLK
jgi:hypothetical protein